MTTTAPLTWGWEVGHDVVDPLTWGWSAGTSTPTGTATATIVETWEQALESSYQRLAVSVDAYLNGAHVASLSVTDGSVSADARRATMRTASLTFAPTASLTIEEVRDILAVPGTEIRPKRGFVYADGSTELAPLGVFVVDELTYQRSADSLSLTATCSDISVRVTRNPWMSAYTVAAGTGLASALAAMLADRYSGVVVGFSATTVPDSVAVSAYYTESSSSDPWQDAQKLAADHGYELYMDADGVVQCILVPDPATASLMYTYARGATAIVTDETHTYPLASTYNGVIVCGETTESAAVRGEAWDEDPASPTYRYGPFGEVPLIVTSSVITTEAQAQAAADARFVKLKGASAQLSWSQIVNAKLAPLHVVGVTDEDGIVSRYVLDQVTTPLSVSGVQAAVTRSTTTEE